jgi:hypothetical protein
MEPKGQEHESRVPFAELPLEPQGPDSPLVLAIRSVAGKLTQ